jgi:hypothetical protein
MIFWNLKELAKNRREGHLVFILPDDGCIRI